MKNTIAKLFIAVFILALTFSGCSNKNIQAEKNTQIVKLEKQLVKKDNTISTQQRNVANKNAEISSLEKQLQQSRTELHKSRMQAKVVVAPIESAPVVPKTQVAPVTNTAHSIVDNSSLTPPNAKAGECYAKLLTPAQYETNTEEKLLTSTVKKLKVTEPIYEMVEYSILEKAESFKYVLIPATYKCVENRVMVEPEKTTYQVIPATFKEIEETIMIAPAQQVWKKGKGLISKINNHTGDIMCLIEEPAQYKTIKTTVVDEPARTEKIVIPALYKNIKAKEIATDARYEKVIIPATYKTIKVQELVTAAEVLSEESPETYQTITTTSMSKAEEFQWERILCETNTNANVVKNVQQALADQNYNPGKIDGVYGNNTQNALTAFQNDNHLASGALTLETLDALGVN